MTRSLADISAEAGEGDGLIKDKGPDVVIENDPDDNTQEVVNIGSHTIKFELDGTRFKLAPRGKIMIHKSYARQKKMGENRDPVASAIEMITGGKVIATSDPRAKGY